MDTTASQTFKVTAALITSKGRIFIAQRPPNKKFGLLWEFPGGKVESGESLRASLVREIGEELSWKIRVGRLFEHVHFNLEDFSLELFAFWCTVEGGSLYLREHVAYHWATPNELSRFDFTLADRHLIASLEKMPSIP